MIKILKNLKKLYELIPLIFDLVELLQQIVQEWDNGLPPSNAAAVKAKAEKLAQIAAKSKSDLIKGGIQV